MPVSSMFSGIQRLGRLHAKLRLGIENGSRSSDFRAHFVAGHGFADGRHVRNRSHTFRPGHAERAHFAVLMCPIELGMLSNSICTWPAIRSVSAGAVPRYGTWTRLMPVIILSNSPDRCGDVPTPPEAKLILPGLALAWAMNSATLLAGTAGCTSMTFANRINPATGALSRMKLNGSLS